MAAMTLDVVPEPEAPNTLTAMSFVDLATPWVWDPTTPARAVPWPLRSVFMPSLARLVPQTALPANC